MTKSNSMQAPKTERNVGHVGRENDDARTPQGVRVSRFERLSKATLVRALESLDQGYPLPELLAALPHWEREEKARRAWRELDRAQLRVRLLCGPPSREAAEGETEPGHGTPGNNARPQ